MDFPLPTLGPKLTAMREEVRTGRGFQLIRCALWPTQAAHLRRLFLLSPGTLHVLRGSFLLFWSNSAWIIPGKK